MPHRLSVAGLILLGVCVAGLQMTEPLVVRYIFDRVLLLDTLDMTSRIRALSIAGVLYLFLVLLSNALGLVRDYRQRLLDARVAIALRRALFARLLYLPLPRLREMKIGGLLSRITGDVDTTIGLLQMAVVSPVISLVRLVMAIGILLALNWRLALLATVVIPGAILVSLLFARRIRPVYRDMRADIESIDGRVGEVFAGIRIVKIFRRELVELLDYIRRRHSVLRTGLFAARRELFLWTTWALLIAGVNVAIVWYGGYLSLTQRASIGDIMAFQWYTLLLLTPVWAIVNSFSELQRSLAATERVFDVLAMQPDMPDEPNARDAPSVVTSLEFQNVAFAYTADREVVRDFSVVVPSGTVVALVGRSGAGKTTVTDLVARLNDPTRGRILLNGMDIRTFRLRSYRGLLAMVDQDVFLFDGSIRDNISYCGQDSHGVDVESAARLANAHEFIDKLPDRYDTRIGERGASLSGGQQQRLAIARAIFASPQILLMDEATSNLDTESEQLIQASMAPLFRGRTTFIIAHRLSTIRRANLILVMDNGHIVESGTHDQLMHMEGSYFRMVHRQMTSEIDGISLSR